MLARRVFCRLSPRFAPKINAQKASLRTWCAMPGTELAYGVRCPGNPEVSRSPTTYRAIRLCDAVFGTVLYPSTRQCPAVSGTDIGCRPT
eukprot:2006097-Rhodomonas_salina.1